ncbi:MAG: MFS transporter, partial [Candidatus Nanohaloarchaea archaeon]|nr:MFS transporter [Candidatus Nanohaloarchaea archaeon]
AGGNTLCTYFINRSVEVCCGEGSMETRLDVVMLSSTHGMQHFFGKIFPPLIPLLATDLQLPLWKLGLVVTLWSLANGLLQAPMGVLSDRYDRKYLLTAGLLSVSLGYFVVAAAMELGAVLPVLEILGVQWSGTLLAIALGMIVAGLGKSVTHPTGYPLLTANVPEGRKGNALGSWGSASKVGDAVGPAFVGVAILVLPWQEVFMAVSVLAALYAAVLFLYMSRSGMKTVPQRSSSSDVGGEGRTDYLLPVGLVLLAMISLSLAFRGVGTYLPTFIAEVHGYSLTLAGVTVGPESVASLYFSLVLLTGAVVMLKVGDVVDDYDPRDIMLVLYLGAAVSVVALTVLPMTPLTLVLVGMALGGTLFATNPARDAIISRVAPEEREGRIFGYFWTILLLTSAGFPVLIGYLADTVGITQGFTYLAAGPLLGMVPLFVLKWMRPDGRQE